MDKKKTFLIVGVVAFIVILVGANTIYYHNVTANKEKYEEEAVDVGIIQITAKEFNDEVLNSEKTVVLEFTSKMCLPCISMLPTLIDIAKNNEDVKVITMDIDDEENSSIVKRYNISATPTIIIFKEEKIEKTFTGAIAEDQIMQAIKSE